MSSVVVAQVPQDVNQVPSYLQDVSVTIKAGFSQGSGVIVRKGNNDFVLTAAHVVKGLRKVRTSIENKQEVKIIEFDDATIMQVVIYEGRTVGRIEYQAKVVKYSDADNGYDVAVLQIRKPLAFDKHIEFYKDNIIPPVLSDVLHCGSLLGEDGANSVTKGSISQHGRIINNRVLDQVSVGAFPGSSGGGIYDKNGYWIAMLVRGAGETFNLVTPIRELKVWAKDNNLMWLFDDSEHPSQSDIDKILVE